MRTLIAKEVRLLLPGWIATTALAILPVWLLPYDHFDPGMLATQFFFLGATYLALSVFGRELGLKTLSFALAQPVPRRKIWRAKITVAGIALLSVFELGITSVNLRCSAAQGSGLSFEHIGFVALMLMVMTSGAICLTICLRQPVAAFFLALLLPVAIASSLQLLGASDRLLEGMFVLYSVAAFVLARRQFLHLQDTAWTGGILTLGRDAATGRISSARERRPWLALVQKEFQLQQVTFAGMASLFLLHCAMVAVRKWGGHSLNGTILGALQLGGFFWLIIPFMAAGQSVADERQLGTMDTLLCLPVSRKTQFVIKLLSVLLIGGVLSGGLLCLTERFADYIHAGAHTETMGIQFDHGHAWRIVGAFIVLSFIGFYGSTLAVGILPGMAVGSISALALWFLVSLPPEHAFFFGPRLWWRIVLPALAAAIVWLAYGNFRYLFESKIRWRRNALVLLGVLVMTFGASAFTFHRGWEYFESMNLPFRAVRIPVGNPVKFSPPYGLQFLATLPDGRVWQGLAGWRTAINGIGQPVREPTFVTNRMLPEARQVVSMGRASGVAAIRRDGTLWISKDFATPQRQCGEDADWKMAAELGGGVVLLKNSGTLWQLTGELGEVSPADHPYTKLNTALQWDRVLAGGAATFLWTKDGEAWVLFYNRQFGADASQAVAVSGSWSIQPMPILNHLHFKGISIVRWWMDVGIRDDGTLWILNLPMGMEHSPSLGMVRVGNGSDWADLKESNDTLAALKTDGSLWTWSWTSGPWADWSEILRHPPERRGSQNQWVGLIPWDADTVALGADGSLWRWFNRDLELVQEEPMPWLLPSKHPAYMENIFDSKD